MAAKAAINPIAYRITPTPPRCRFVDNLIGNPSPELKRKMADEIVDNLVSLDKIEAMTETTSLPRGPLGTDIAEWTRERIRKGRLVPGQRLVEVDIIRQTGASRSKVREALQRLEGEGLVQIDPFRGASVRTASIEEVRQIYRARIALEGIAAGDFVRNADASQRTRLYELQEKLESCVAGNAPERFGRLNTEWHGLLVEGSGNAVIADVLRRLNVPIHRLLFESFYNSDRLRVAIADHALIIAAIEANDPAAAEAAMRKHIEDGFQTLSAIDHEVRG